MAGRQEVTAETLPESRASAPATGTETVVVGLKLPNGLQIYAERKVTQRYPAPGGYQDVDVFQEVPGTRVVLRGNAVNFDLLRRGVLPDYPTANGYALTEGVPKDVFEAWLANRRHEHLVTERLIFAAPSVAEARKIAADMGKTRSGLEPIDPERPELHTGRQTLRGVSTVLPADVVRAA